MDSWPKKTFWLTATVLSYLSNVQPVSAAPARPHEKESFNNASLFSIDFGVSTLKGRDTSIPLRILGVGASIMAGWGSTTYNGCAISFFSLDVVCLVIRTYLLTNVQWPKAFTRRTEGRWLGCGHGWQSNLREHG